MQLKWCRLHNILLNSAAQVIPYIPTYTSQYMYIAELVCIARRSISCSYASWFLVGWSVHTGPVCPGVILAWGSPLNTNRPASLVGIQTASWDFSWKFGPRLTCHILLLLMLVATASLSHDCMHGPTMYMHVGIIVIIILMYPHVDQCGWPW